MNADNFAWPMLNRERGGLIDKDIAGTLTEKERDRLTYLQGYADGHIEATPSGVRHYDYFGAGLDTDSVMSLIHETPADSIARMEAAEAELVAQLEIIRVFKRLPSADHRKRVAHAVFHLLQADEFVPGVLDAYLAGSKKTPA